jgi:hypothetical protein
MIALLAVLWSPAAHACGGFFCDNIDPVVQTAERILFKVEPDGQISTFVEIQFQGPPGNFGWVVPIPEPIDPETEISTAPAGLFDALEEQTAPRFVSSADAKVAACGCGPVGEGPGMPDISGVSVVGEAVVGPYAIEIITAESGDNLTNWLAVNGYQIPQTAAPAMQHYVDLGMAFVGVKLTSDYNGGPIDTLVLSCAQDAPTIPLILTSIAATQDMEITAYVLGAERFVPGNWADLAFDWSRVSPDGSNYEYELGQQADDAGGRAWNTEFAGPSAPVLQALPMDVNVALGSGNAYLTRFHAFVSPEEMTEDPQFVADPTAPDVDNVNGDAPADTAGVGNATLIALLAAGSLLRRRS